MKRNGKGKKQLYKYSLLFIFLLIFTNIGSVLAGAENMAAEMQEIQKVQEAQPPGEEGGEIFGDEPFGEIPDIEGSGENSAEGNPAEENITEENITEEIPPEEDIFQSDSETEIPPEEERPFEEEPSFEEGPPAEEAPLVAPEEEKNTEELSDGSVELFADGGSGTNIRYENGFHYIHDDQYKRDILLYCMNRDRLWPNHTSGGTVPGYEEDYLTPDNFDSPDEYNECMRRLAKLLYAGYPYNGERLYKIVSQSEAYVPSVKEFNEMLVPLPILQTAFPYLGHHDFKYSDWNADENKQNKEHIDLLNRFLEDVMKLFQGGTTENGLYYADIVAMPFYQAASSISMANNFENADPLSQYAITYGKGYFVTKEEAYNATQNAVWALMNHYGIEDNNQYNEELLTNNKLAQSLFTYSERGGLLNREPQENEITIEGDLTFRYNNKDGYYHSGVLRIKEPPEFHGLYNLSLPDGVRALCDNLTYVYGDEPYELVSKTMPPKGSQFTINAEFVWMKEFKQYHPSEEITVGGKQFQNMVGAVINTKSISKSASFKRGQEGSLKITKKSVVEENKNPNKEFDFYVTFPERTDINGQYGDLLFTNGTSEPFTLKAGDSKTVSHIPPGTKYEVIESDSGSYVITGTGITGTIQDNVIAKANFTNIRRPQLTLSKEVTGEAGNKTETFTFEITLNDKDNKPVKGIYDYKGGVKQGFENQGITPPEDGNLEFKKGKATIRLSHGQQITILDLPDKSTYTIKEINADSYTTTYNNEDVATGTLNSQEKKHVTEEVHVVNNKEFAPDTGFRDTNGRGTAAGLAIVLSGALLLAGEIFLKKRIKK